MDSDARQFLSFPLKCGNPIQNPQLYCWNVVGLDFGGKLIDRDCTPFFMNAVLGVVTPFNNTVKDAFI